MGVFDARAVIDHRASGFGCHPGGSRSTPGFLPDYTALMVQNICEIMQDLPVPPRAQTTDPENLLRLADRLLAACYGTPRLNNKRHPVSELIFIILSARTQGRNHETTYRRLRRRFRTWEVVRDTNVANIKEVIEDAGLGRIKARQIQRLLRQITADFGTLNGAALRRMDTPSLERYLTTLPGVGLKTARCTMLYALDRPVFSGRHALHAVVREPRAHSWPYALRVCAGPVAGCGSRGSALFVACQRGCPWARKVHSGGAKVRLMSHPRVVQ